MAEADEKSGVVGGEAGGARYCRGCGYDLRALTERRCPECGRGFDPGDRRSTLRRPLRWWMRWVWRMGYAVLAVILLLAAVCGWFYWGWYEEQQALRRLRAVDHAEEPLSPWLQKRLGYLGFVLDRVRYMHLSDRTDPEEFGTVTHLTQLERLWLERTPVRDLRPLTGLPQLRVLVLWDRSVTDLRPLGDLPKLEELWIQSPTPLDVTPLMRCKSLRYLSLSPTTATEAEVEELRRALPDCEIPPYSLMLIPRGRGGGGRGK